MIWWRRRTGFQSSSQGLSDRAQCDGQRGRRPDQQFYENYSCGSERNYTGYCNPELQKRFDRQSAEADQQKRKALVWDIDKQLQEDVARPIVYHIRGGTCWQPQLKGLTLMVNGIFNGNRFEDIWLDK